MSRQVKPVAILGCGPAGLLAAHAADLLGHDPVVFSLKHKSVMPGAQYLHDPIPRLCTAVPDGEIRYTRVGTQQGYALKVYGSPDAPCSWDKFESSVAQPCWAISKMYDRLWDRFHSDINDVQVSRKLLLKLQEDFPLVISTIPRTHLCRDREAHNFTQAHIWISDKVSAPLSHGNVIMYNGDPRWHWYRTSCIFGHESTESAQPMEGAHKGCKPTGHSCDCWPDIVKTGRFGKWERGVLVHHAFNDALQAIDSKLGRTRHALL